MIDVDVRWLDLPDGRRVATKVREGSGPATLVFLPGYASDMEGGKALALDPALAGTTGQAWPWVQLLTVFAVVYVTMGVLAFGPLLEES